MEMIILLRPAFLPYGMAPLTTVGSIKRLNTMNTFLVQMLISVDMRMYETPAEEEPHTQKDDAGCNN